MIGSTDRRMERKAVLCMNGWAGYSETPVIIVGETPKKYRIRLPDTRLPGEGIKLPKRRYLHTGEVALVPKTAVKIKEDK